MAAALAGVATIRYSYAEYGEALERYRGSARPAPEDRRRGRDRVRLAEHRQHRVSAGGLSSGHRRLPAQPRSEQDDVQRRRRIASARGPRTGVHGAGRLRGRARRVRHRPHRQAHGRRPRTARADRAKHRRRALPARQPRCRAGQLRREPRPLRSGWRPAERRAGSCRRRPSPSSSRRGSIAPRTSTSAAPPSARRQTTASAPRGRSPALPSHSRRRTGSSTRRRPTARRSQRSRHARLREEAARSEIGLSQALAGAGDFAGGVEAAVRARREAMALENDDIMWRALTAEARAVRKLGDGRACARHCARGRRRARSHAGCRTGQAGDEPAGRCDRRGRHVCGAARGAWRCTWGIRSVRAHARHRSARQPRGQRARHRARHVGVGARGGAHARDERGDPGGAHRPGEGPPQARCGANRGAAAIARRGDGPAASVDGAPLRTAAGPCGLARPRHARDGRPTCRRWCPIPARCCCRSCWTRKRCWCLRYGDRRPRRTPRRRLPIQSMKRTSRR